MVAPNHVLYGGYDHGPDMVALLSVVAVMDAPRWLPRQIKGDGLGAGENGGETGCCPERPHVGSNLRELVLQGG
jgi:hypothetical protein